MQNMTEIKNRIKNISETRKITGAMETISAAKMRKAMQKYESTKIFFDRISDAICDIVLNTENLSVKYFTEPQIGAPAIYIVIASDKGMAGAYNSNILKHAWQIIEKDDNKASSILSIGHTARVFFQKKGRMADFDFSEASFAPTKKDAANISDTVLGIFNEGKAGRVFLSYTHMYEHSVMTPTTIQLLPIVKENLSKNTKNTNLINISYEPSPEEVMKQLIPLYLRWIIYGALCQSSASEHYSRHLAMSSATKNASDILDGLKKRYHQARQEAITKELNEIMLAETAAFD